MFELGTKDPQQVRFDTNRGRFSRSGLAGISRQVWCGPVNRKWTWPSSLRVEGAEAHMSYRVALPCFASPEAFTTLSSLYRQSALDLIIVLTMIRMWVKLALNPVSRWGRSEIPTPAPGEAAQDG
jgi:hypothetical protein